MQAAGGPSGSGRRAREHPTIMFPRTLNGVLVFSGHPAKTARALLSRRRKGASGAVGRWRCQLRTNLAECATVEKPSHGHAGWR
eukprot:8847863-Pyramimonas_sp.AAC.1